MRVRSIAKATIFTLLVATLSNIQIQEALAAECIKSSTYQSGYTYLAFKDTSATCTWTVPASATTIDLLLVGGGGSGGSRHGAGGGAGGLIRASNVSLSGVTSLNIKIGDGGAAVRPSSPNYAVGIDGETSTVVKNVGAGSFTNLAAVGGGGGEAGATGPRSGGSGGGSQYANLSSPISGQGNRGGAGGTNGSNWWSGGGGGAGGVGSDSSSSGGGAGGIGAIWLQSFTTTVATALALTQTNQTSGDQVNFAGGGGGSITSSNPGAGGLGGGGSAVLGNNTATSGTANSGGGGGGSGCCDGGWSGKGGSGVLLIRYLSPSIFEAANYTAGSTSWSNSNVDATSGTAPTGGMTKNATPNAVIFSGKQVSNSDQLTSSIGSTTYVDTVTVEMWLKLLDNGSTDNASGSMLFSWAGSSSYNVYHYQDQIGFNNFSNQLYGVNSASYNNSWKHYVFVMTDTGPWSSQKIYIDGVLQSSGCIVSPSNCSAAQTRSFHGSGNFVLMDNQYSSNTWNAKGQIGLVRIYTQELSQPTIQNLYNLTSSTYQIPVPVNSILPAISGTTTFGSTLTSSEGTWSNTPTSYTYQWLRATTSGGSYTSIPTAVNSTYELDNADVNQYLKVAVTANNNGGSTTETSTATAQISAAASSASLSVAVGTLVFRQSKTISATASVAGKLTFRANNVIISGCKNLVAVANVSRNCSYKPARRGNIRITVTLVPTSGSFRTSVTESDTYFVTQRSGSR
jgi:hypothetical protein